MSSTSRVRQTGALVRHQNNLQWWKVCFVHGDQTKFYRQLYGKRAAIKAVVASGSDQLGGSECDQLATAVDQSVDVEEG